MATREDIVRKVQALWTQADDPAATEAERKAFMEKARELMAKYTIDEIVLAEAKGGEEQIAIAHIRIYKEESVTLVPDQRIYLAHTITVHHRCKCVISNSPASVDLDGHPIQAGTYIVAVGYSSDLATVRLMYTVLGADMIMAMSEEPTGHMNQKAKRDYDANFCDGFVEEIDRRLSDIERRVNEMAEGMASGSLLPAIMSRAERVKAKFDELYPPASLGKQKTARFASDPNARARGQAAARDSDVGGQGVGSSKKGVGRGVKGEIG